MQQCVYQMMFKNVDAFRKRLVKSGLVCGRTLFEHCRHALSYTCKRERVQAVASEKRDERERARFFPWASDNTYERVKASEMQNGTWFFTRALVIYEASVCLSVRPSVSLHSAIVSKRWKLWSWNLHCRLPQIILYSFRILERMRDRAKVTINQL